MIDANRKMPDGYQAVPLCGEWCLKLHGVALQKEGEGRQPYVTFRSYSEAVTYALEHARKVVQ